MRLIHNLFCKGVTAAACGLLLALSAACAAEDEPSMSPDVANQTPAEIISQAEHVHPAVLYILASKLMGEGRMEEAVQWFYIGQLRYRFHIASDPPTIANDQPLFAALNESVGRPINEYAFGDVDEAVRLIDAALAWDADHANHFTPKDRYPEQLAELRGGLQDMRNDMMARKEEIRDTRTRNGLANR